jgi:site-specific DNA-methyltransferase (adenine-specific)
MFVTKPIAETCGFKFWKPLIWDKINIGMGYHYRCRYEFVLFFEKGKRNLNNRGISDIIQSKMIKNGYPAEKPVDLMKTLVRQSAMKGELVCDPFYGSGSTGVAAVEEGCHFIGTDLSPDAQKIATVRLICSGAKENHDPPWGEQLGLPI